VKIDSTISDREAMVDLPAAETEVARLCEGFQKRWESGDRPRIEDFLIETGEIDQSTLLSRLIMLDVRERVRHGERPQLDDYISRFPSSADVISRLTPLFRDSGSELAKPDHATAFLDACTVNRLGDLRSTKGWGPVRSARSGGHGIGNSSVPSP